MSGGKEKVFDISVFNSSGIRFLPIKKARELSELVLSRKSAEGKLRYTDFSLNIVFLSDSDIHQMNKDFLQHDYPTDVITFTIEDNGTELEGEIYIGAETAKKQAEEYSVSLTHEILRLVAHGCLHLMGMDDSTPDEKDKMTQDEDRFLNMYNSQ